MTRLKLLLAITREYYLSKYDRSRLLISTRTKGVEAYLGAMSWATLVHTAPPAHLARQGGSVHTILDVHDILSTSLAAMSKTRETER